MNKGIRLSWLERVIIITCVIVVATLLGVIITYLPNACKIVRSFFELQECKIPLPFSFLNFINCREDPAPIDWTKFQALVAVEAMLVAVSAIIINSIWERHSLVATKNSFLEQHITQAIEFLSNPSSSVRESGVRTLYRIAVDDKDSADRITKILISHARNERK